MPSDRTFVTELVTALGMAGEGSLDAALASRPGSLRNVTDEDWPHLVALWRSGAYAKEFDAGWRNGRAFLAAPDALNCRLPRLIEWTGGRRPPGDEVVPADLRIDHVYLVSCKYLSQILHNPSPARLVEGLLSTAPVADSRDWYVRSAPDQYQTLYERCADAAGGGFPMFAMSLEPEQRRRLAGSLKDGWPPGAAEAYDQMCRVVADATASEWRSRIASANAEAVLWRLLRIGSVPYFVLGASAGGSMRLRIDTPWDWRREFRLERFSVEAQPGGQPRVGWTGVCEVRASGAELIVRGHVEIRWSHGRFGQPPEAKVYLDCPHETVPGYHEL